MSCLSCGGCFTGTGCSTTKPSSRKHQGDGAARFQSLLDLAASSAHDTSTENVHHDHIIPTIVAELSNQVYASQIVLFQAYETCTLEEFLRLAALLQTNGVRGMHIAWAAEYCQNNPRRLLDVLSDNEKISLLQHCDDQAEMHEMFAQLVPGSVGRTRQ
ncbi:MAG: hypothetical protein EXX96DRAFT_580524 [Benjaminiella poitrasii]|nr:MAG: hypothetical protein EXX96DRAFT_580524 [Benjaminiella poitrasii]